MSSFANGHANGHDNGNADGHANGQDGMDLNSPASPPPSEDRRPNILSPLSTVPMNLQIIMKELTDIIRHTLGENHHTSTSEINAPIDHGLLRGVLIELHASDMKLPDDVGVVISAIQSYLHSGSIDVTNPLVERIVNLTASIPEESKGRNVIAGALVKNLWEILDHPPLTRLGDQYKYRAADGSNNSVIYPDLGKAGSAYARSVKPVTVLPAVLPDPSTIFDALFARDGPPKEHPSKISSMLFYLATIIIHDVFLTNEHDYNKVDSSSYLDLGSLYGQNEEQQAAVRTFVDGKLKPDAFSEVRILGFPPGVCALLVSFNRFHNYVVEELANINEGGRFSLPVESAQEEAYEAAMKKRENDLFQVGRLITCGLYVHIILGDYFKTILNLNRTSSTWNLDPLADFGETTVPSATGNQVSVEFNLLSRWHTAMSAKDELWAHDFYRKIFPNDDPATLSLPVFTQGLREWEHGVNPDPGKRTFGKLERQANGSFEDAELVKLLQESTEDVAGTFTYHTAGFLPLTGGVLGAFGARNVPAIMKAVEILGMEQARSWKVATLNELREFFQLKPHESYLEINSDPGVAAILEALYPEIGLVEFYPGIVAEQAALPDTIGQGLCPGSTISKAILLNTVALVRGDRHYTVDYTTGSLTNWGYKQVSGDPKVADGGVIYKLLMRAYPSYYADNSVYAMFPLTIPSETRKILQALGNHQEHYDFSPPSFVGPPPISITSWTGVTNVLNDQTKFKVPWGPRIWSLTGHDYMLSDDSPESAIQKVFVLRALSEPRDWLDEIQQFYETLTMQLVRQNSAKLRKIYQLDAVRIVGNASHANFIAYLFKIPLLDSSYGDGTYTDLELYNLLASIYAYVFVDLDPSKSFALKVAATDAAKKLGREVQSVCAKLFSDLDWVRNSLESIVGRGPAERSLINFGSHLIHRLAAGGKSIDEVTWTIVPTAATAVATQAQGFAQMLDLYLSEPYKSHWPAIQELAASNTFEAFEKLERYALEGYRLNTPAFGLTRIANADTTIEDGNRSVPVKKGDRIFVDFTKACLDPTVFPNPHAIDTTRPIENYIHHGWGPHNCIGRPIVVTAMAAQLRVFAQLKNLRRAPGVAGELKSKTVNGGPFKVYMKEDWSDWWPFPATMNVQWDGFESWSPFAKGSVLLTKYPFHPHEME